MHMPHIDPGEESLRQRVSEPTFRPYRPYRVPRGREIPCGREISSCGDGIWELSPSLARTWSGFPGAESREAGEPEQRRLAVDQGRWAGTLGSASPCLFRGQ